MSVTSLNGGSRSVALSGQVACPTITIAGALPGATVGAPYSQTLVATVADIPRYPLDGASRLQAHLHTITGRTNIVVVPTELHIVGVDASTASAAQG